MARRRSPGHQEAEEAAGLKVTPARAKELIDRAVEEANDLLAQAHQVTDPESYDQWTHDCERWDARTKAALESAFVGAFPDEFHRAATGGIFRVVGQANDQTFAYRKEAISNGVNTLRSIEERMEFLEAPGEVLEQRPRTPGGRQVFVIHGRDQGLRAQVARLLERLDLEPIILAEQPDRGQTIIEKFEAHSLDVGYAIAIFTAEDYGRGPDDDDWPPGQTALGRTLFSSSDTSWARLAESASQHYLRAIWNIRQTSTASSTSRLIRVGSFDSPRR